MCCEKKLRYEAFRKIDTRLPFDLPPHYLRTAPLRAELHELFHDCHIKKTFPPKAFMFILFFYPPQRHVDVEAKG